MDHNTKEDIKAGCAFLIITLIGFAVLVYFSPWGQGAVP